MRGGLPAVHERLGLPAVGLSVREERLRRRLHDLGLGDADIARLRGVGKRTVTAWRRSRGLASNHGMGGDRTSAGFERLRRERLRIAAQLLDEEGC